MSRAAAYQREYRRRERARWKAAGLCYRCGSPDRGRFLACAACRKARGRARLRGVA